MLAEAPARVLGYAVLAGKRRISVGIILLQVDVLIWQLVQTNRPKKRLRRLNQQDRFRKTVVVEAAPEMNTRFDRHNVEGADVQTHGLERKRFDDLHQICAQDQDVVAPELDADQKATITFYGIEDRALDAHRFARGFVSRAADLHI